MSEGMQPGPLTDPNIFILKVFLSSIAVQLSLYGIYSALVMIVLYKLWTNKAQLAADHIPIAAMIIMFIASTTQICMSLAFCLIQLPTFGFSPPNDERPLIIMRIFTATMTRLNYLIGDSIVVWRAWVLWTNHSRAHMLLCICLFGTLVGVTVDLAFEILFDSSQLSDNPRFSPIGSRTLILTLPLLMTNIISTLVIAYQVWEYKVEIMQNLGLFSHNKRTKAERVLILLTESGSIYCLLWGIYPIIMILIITLQKANLQTTVNGPSFSTPDFTTSHIESVMLDLNTNDRPDSNTNDVAVAEPLGKEMGKHSSNHFG
ncbi:hypothetical protein C8J56DRAFT_898390 [Mycena floridula]|nr:hypothetical protein C8J56DRAFT_898390 [Mycena floridula]